MTFFLSGVREIWMKSCLVIVVSFLCVAVKQSRGARILENGLFISPENPSPFNPQHNSPFSYPAENGVISCEESGITSWNGPANAMNYKEQDKMLKFAFKENGRNKSPKSNDGVVNKGGDPPSGTANDILKGERLFNHSPEKRILGSNPSPSGGH